MQERQAVAQAKVFAIGSRVLPDERHFADAGRGEIFRLAHDGFKPPAAEFSAQLRDDAERAGMVAAFGNLDVRGVFRRRENPRRKIVIQIRRKRRRARRIRLQFALDGSQNIFDLARPHHRIDLGNLRENLLAVTLDQASGHD